MSPPQRTHRPAPRSVTSIDVVPARVRGLDGGEEVDHRVFLGGGRVRVFRPRKGPSRGIDVVLDAVVASAEHAGERGTWTIRTKDGRELRVAKQSGCGCGSPLLKIDRKTLRGTA